jgi:hypothetical protein
MSENKTKENDNHANNKEDNNKLIDNFKIPNSLIIYIKTRIPNYYKMNYEPFMTVPKEKSHTVYFDPLIKYYEGPIKNFPSAAPTNTLFTQFFEAAEFDSMINRTLSDFRYMQKPRTFIQAYEERIIDNNMKLTLKTLFKPNNLFYINKKPYTIINSHWNDNDWQIDKKPIDKLLRQFSHLTIKQITDEAKKEEDSIPETIRQGNLSSSNLSNDETISSVSTGLQNAVDNAPNGQNMSIVTDSFVHQDNLPGVSNDIKRLYSEFLKQNAPINYSDTADLSRDPITISLLVDPAELLKFINNNKKSSIIELYSAFITSKTNLQLADKEYIDACTELAIYKTNFDNEFRDIKNDLGKNLNKEEINNVIQKITLQKVGYMKIIFRIADAIMQIYNLQHEYFVSSKLLLEGLKNDYVNIIKYYEKPELAIKCIEYDISTISSFIELDPEDNYSQSYFFNLNNFKTFYEKSLYKNENLLINPQINYADISNDYLAQPSILMLEKQQYEIYNFKMFLFYSYNQFDIWILLYKSMQNFAKFIGTEATNISVNSELTLEKYNKLYSKEEQDEFLEKKQVDGVRANYNKKTKRLNWFLVKSDGARCIAPFKEIYKQKKPLSLIKDEIQERKYISLLKTQVNSYDSIILYIYLLEINCLRQNRILIAEENVNQLNLEYSLSLNDYYQTIEKMIKTSNSPANIPIPESFLWDTTDLHDINFLDKRSASNDKSSIVYRGRIKALQKSREKLNKTCESIADIITPTISNSGFVDKCNSILESNVTDVTGHSFRSSYWLNKTIKNYDMKSTNDFIYNINKVVKDAWYDRIINNREPEDYLDWMVYDNSGTNATDSLFASISDALNGQLDLNGDETNNPYTDVVNGIHRFTVDSLKRIIKDVDDDPNISTINIANILQNVLKIKFIVFEMFPRPNPEITFGDIVYYNDEKCRVIDKIYVNDGVKYTLNNGNRLFDNVPLSDIALANSNIASLFRIQCSEIKTDIEFNDFIYLALCDNEFLKYKLVRNYITGNYIFSLQDIPTYINYLIYNTCIRFHRIIDYELNGLKEFKPIFDNFNETINKQMQIGSLNNQLDEVIDELDNKKEQYRALKKIKNRTQDEKSEKALLKDDIKELIARKEQLSNLLKNETSNGLTSGELTNGELIGGELTRGELEPKPSEQYVDYSSSNMYPNNGYPSQGYYKPLGYPMNPNMPNNAFYIPRQRRLPHNVSQNKAKDSKSKLSFYITIELELFPGTSASALQKSVVKCQSTFERIREAYADLFGFQYKPAPMNEAYAYNYQKSEPKNKTEKNTKEVKHGGKTRKNKT